MVRVVVRVIWWLACEASLKFFIFFTAVRFFSPVIGVGVCFLFSCYPLPSLVGVTRAVFFFSDARGQYIFIFLFLKAFMFSLEQLRNASPLPPELDSLNYLCSCLYLRRFVFICTFFLPQNSCKI